jgi:hypothetical protein
MFKITLRNSTGGELDCRICESQDETRAAALDILTSLAFLSDGDTLVVSETPND